MPPIPKTIGRYEIVELVGRGGMGVLYRARDAVLERDVALKMMLVDFTIDPAARERFQREAKAVARLQHRNVVTIHELGEADGTPYIVMELLGGKDLDALLKAETALTLTEKLDVAIQLCEGLGFAHEQGIVHRDIKPGNVRVLEDGTVKILDFGIAKFAMSSVTQSGTIMGTASYMAPEQIMGQPVDGRADLFSVGVLLHELLTGHKPFAADSATAAVYQIMHTDPPPVRSLVPELPEELEAIVGRALKKNPDERYSRASEMASDLQMVKMMLDLPLHPGDTAPAGGGSPSVTAKLHATTIGSKTGAPSTVVLNTPMRASAAAAAADAAPRASAARGGRTGLIWAVAGAVVVVAGIAVIVALRGRGGEAPAATAGAGAPAGGTGGAAGTKTGATPVAPPAEDLLVVSSLPVGAHILLNGVDTGKVTPAAVTIGNSQPRALGLSLKGYQTLAATITDAELKAGNKEFKLVREAGPVHLTVSGGYAFEVLQGDRVLSPAAHHHEVTVQPGGGTVSARSKEYLLNAAIPIDFQRPQADVTLPGPGTLAVFAAVETCSIVVDGEDLGFPPIPRKPIAAGPHKVTLKCADGKDDSKSVTVVPGERLQVTFGPPKTN